MPGSLCRSLLFYHAIFHRELGKIFEKYHKPLENVLKVAVGYLQLKWFECMLVWRGARKRVLIGGWSSRSCDGILSSCVCVCVCVGV